jgi:hypothetical protein
MPTRRVIPSKASKRLAVVAVPLAAITLAAVVIGALLRDSDSGPGPQLVEPRLARVIINPHLESGSEFSVTYEAVNPAHTPLLQPAVAMTLHRESELLNCLLATGNPRVRPGECTDTPDVAMSGPGPFSFILPDVPRGRYILCGYIGLGESSPLPSKPEPFCREIEIVSP